MFIIEKSIIDNKINLNDNKIKNNKDLENEIFKKIIETYYIGFVIFKKRNINYYILIKELIRL
jgi:hypothetical protein